MNSKEMHARAELGFKKFQRAATTRARPMAEYVAEGEKRRIQSSKLKALRLAKEAEDLAAAQAVPAKKPTARKTVKK